MTHAMLQPDQGEGWRGEIRDGQVVKTHEEAIDEEERERAGQEAQGVPAGEAEQERAEHEGVTTAGEREPAGVPDRAEPGEPAMTQRRRPPSQRRAPAARRSAEDRAEDDYDEYEEYAEQAPAEPAATGTRGRPAPRRRSDT